MVIRYELAGMDLAEVRFAISPLNEMVLSLRAWRDPGRYPAHLPWVRQLDEARRQLDSELLWSLTNTRLWTPDFLTPRPSSPLSHISEQLDQLDRTSLHGMADELRALHAGSPQPPALRAPVLALRRRIVAALRQYWDICFAPHWPRMRSLLEADVMHRAREMAQHGSGYMFSRLESNIRFADNVVSVRLVYSNLSYRRSTDGAGLTLVPTMFTRSASTPTTADHPPTIYYGVRGLGTLWQVQRPVTPQAVAGLLGRTRADLLIRLGEPASSTELASRLGVSVPAVNQHLRALHAGGLLTSARNGRAVLYRRSALGDALLASG